jgi:hypothetical protein
MIEVTKLNLIANSISLDTITDNKVSGFTFIPIHVIIDMINIDRSKVVEIENSLSLDSFFMIVHPTFCADLAV